MEHSTIKACANQITKAKRVNNKNLILQKISDQTHTIENYIDAVFHTSTSGSREYCLQLLENLLQWESVMFIDALNKKIKFGRKGSKQIKPNGMQSYLANLITDGDLQSELLKQLEGCIRERVRDPKLHDFTYTINDICCEYDYFREDGQKDTRSFIGAICEFEEKLNSIHQEPLSESQAKEYLLKFSELFAHHTEDGIKVFLENISRYLTKKVERAEVAKAAEETGKTEKTEVAKAAEVAEVAEENEGTKARKMCSLLLNILARQVLNIQDIQNIQNEYKTWDEFIASLIQELERIALQRINGIPELLESLILEYGPRFVIKLNSCPGIVIRIVEDKSSRKSSLGVLQKCFEQFQYQPSKGFKKKAIQSLIKIYEENFQKKIQEEKNCFIRSRIYDSIEELSENLEKLSESDYISEMKTKHAVLTLLYKIYFYKASQKHDAEYFNEKYIDFSDRLIKFFETHKPLHEREDFHYQEIITVEEDFNTEFKKSVLPIDRDLFSEEEGNEYHERLEKTICSMLNFEGGIMYLGIDDNKSMIIGGITNDDAFKEALEERLKAFDSQNKPKIKEHVNYKIMPINGSKNRLVKVIITPKDNKEFSLRKNFFYRGDATTLNLETIDIINKRNIEEIQKSYKINSELLLSKFHTTIEQNKDLKTILFRNYDENLKFIVEMVKYQKKIYTEKLKKEDDVDRYNKIQNYLLEKFALSGPKRPHLKQRTLLFVGENLGEPKNKDKYQDLELKQEKFLLTDDDLFDLCTEIESLWSGKGGRIYIGVDPDSNRVKGIDLNRKERDNFKSGLCYNVYSELKIVPNSFINIYFIPLFDYYAKEIIPGKFVVKVIVIGKPQPKKETPYGRIFKDPPIDSKSIQDNSCSQHKPRVFIEAYLN